MNLISLWFVTFSKNKTFTVVVEQLNVGGKHLFISYSCQAFPSKFHGTWLCTVSLSTSRMEKNLRNAHHYLDSWLNVKVRFFISLFMRSRHLFFQNYYSTIFYYLCSIILEGIFQLDSVGQFYFTKRLLSFRFEIEANNPSLLVWPCPFSLSLPYHINRRQWTEIYDSK